MPIISQSSSNWMLSLKVVFISTGVLSMAVMLKLSVPVITEFAVSEVPSIWSFVASWLRPPYLYLVINCIIITIVASSKFQQKVDHSPPETVVHPVPIKIIGDVQADFPVAYDDSYTSAEVRPEFGYGYDANVDVKAASSGSDVYRGANSETKTTMNVNALDQEMNESHDELAISRLSTSNKRSTEYSLPTEKPLVSARFGHRKAVKASHPEGGRALGVVWKPKRQDTLEATWKTITDGRPMPLTRHLRKSDTWETNTHQPRHITTATLPLPHQKMAKSETFTATTSDESLGPGKLRKEPSPSQDELNRRVEAFIRKFNEDMRLQRQESLDQYMQMINRGAH